MESDPHLVRLSMEYTKLVNLARRSKGRIRIDPVEVVSGMAPDKYIITFSCKGIARIDVNKEPVASELHRVSMYITQEYPQGDPFLLWLTPIWHPNIRHEEPRRVCTNKEENYFSTKGLDDYVLLLGEMVQYKRYHAYADGPLFLDTEVAAWVREYAEPRGIVGPDKPFDPHPFVRAYNITSGSKTSSSKQAPIPRSIRQEKIDLGVKRTLSRSSVPTCALVRKPGLAFGAKRKP